MVILAAPAAATAGYPGANGRIFFDTGGGGDVYSIKPDGSDRQRIVQNGRDPAVSADGRMIVFMRRGDLFTANRSGENEQQVTTSNGVPERNPSFSPSGNKILFATESRADNPSQIFTVRVDGTDPTRLTQAGRGNFDPEYSPNGNRIVFVRVGDDGVESLFLMDADGTNVEQLTSGDLACRSPSWSPDGDRIAFSGFDGSFSIFTARPNATDPVRLTGVGLGDFEPAWSPDGSRIVFRGKRDQVSGLFTVGRSIPFVERLTRSTPKPGVGVDGSPYWAPQP